MLSTTNTPLESQLDSTKRAALSNLAQTIIENQSIPKDDKVIVICDKNHEFLGEEIAELVARTGAKSSIYLKDLDREAIELANLKPTEIGDYYRKFTDLFNSSTRRISVRNPANPEAMSSLPVEIKKAHSSFMHALFTSEFAHIMEWSVVCPPTEYEARKEGISFDEYFNIYIEACLQPWKEIEKTQEILIQKLDSGKYLEFIVNPDDPNPEFRTHLKMSIDGMTFCNSTVKRNFPGSEVFSAPVLNSVEGHIHAAGEFLYENEVMKNLQFTFEKGRIVRAYAESNLAHLERILANGIGARYLGEIAFGTNPGLKRRFFNDLLCEKVGGSFHFALGHCYDFKTYNGKLVNVNNGNTEDLTENHWDISVLMHPACGGGRVLLDGELIQENGVFVDPRLWALSPKHLR